MRYPPRYYGSLHRFVVPGIVRNAPYDTLLTGSSIIENTRNATIGAICGGTGLNAAMPALTGYEQGLVLRTAFATHTLKRAIVVVDFTGYNGAPDARHPLAGPLPSYLYDANPLNDAPYLLSWSVLVKSWRIVEGDTSERFRSDPDAPWWWADQKRFARSEVVRNLDPRDLNRQFPQLSLDLAQMRTSFERNLLPVMAAHPETEFDLVWPPYSVVVWGDYVQRRQLDTTLAFKRYVFAATRDLPNVRIVDLQPRRGRHPRSRQLHRSLPFLSRDQRMAGRRGVHRPPPRADRRRCRRTGARPPRPGAGVRSLERSPHRPERQGAGRFGAAPGGRRLRMGLAIVNANHYHLHSSTPSLQSPYGSHSHDPAVGRLRGRSGVRRRRDVHARDPGPPVRARPSSSFPRARR